MPTTIPPTPIRLRQIPGDPRLHVTENGSTTSGHLEEASIQLVSGEFPTAILGLRESLLTPPDEPPTTLRLATFRILAADVAALNYNALGAYEGALLRRILETTSRCFDQSPLPPCAHEDVVETPELGRVEVPGICMWCPLPLVKRDDYAEWKPAST
jgi:hypothetical protein